MLMMGIYYYFRVDEDVSYSRVILLLLLSIFKIVSTTATSGSGDVVAVPLNRGDTCSQVSSLSHVQRGPAKASETRRAGSKGAM